MISARIRDAFLESSGMVDSVWKRRLSHVGTLDGFSASSRSSAFKVDWRDGTFGVSASESELPASSLSDEGRDSSESSKSLDVISRYVSSGPCLRAEGSLRNPSISRYGYLSSVELMRLRFGGAFSKCRVRESSSAGAYATIALAIRKSW